MWCTLAACLAACLEQSKSSDFVVFSLCTFVTRRYKHMLASLFIPTLPPTACCFLHSHRAHYCIQWFNEHSKYQLTVAMYWHIRQAVHQYQLTFTSLPATGLWANSDSYSGTTGVKTIDFSLDNHFQGKTRMCPVHREKFKGLWILTNNHFVFLPVGKMELQGTTVKRPVCRASQN